MMKTTLLKTIYARNLNGIPVLGTPREAAERFGGDGGGAMERSEQLTRWYTGFCGATGFVCGLPGWLLLPVTLPSNLVGVAVLQMHMVQAVAVLNGHDLSNASTQDGCVTCMLEKLRDEGTHSEEDEVVQRTGIKLLERGARFAVGHVTSLAGRAARFAAVRRLPRLPLIGGALGAGSDAYMTRHVARCALRTFVSDASAT